MKALGLLLCAALACRGGDDDRLPDGEVLLRALADEMKRSMTLRLNDMEPPYFIQYSVDDGIAYDIAASFGAITSYSRSRQREFYSFVRVGSCELDNSNFSTGGYGYEDGGGAAYLPLVDDYTAIRQAVWWATDEDYKGAVERLAQKRAYMSDRNIKDRPNDYETAEPIVCLQPSPLFAFDGEGWREAVRKLSAGFRNYPQIRDSSVRLTAGIGHRYVVNSEGTRVRVTGTGILLSLHASVQATDGMLLSDSRLYYSESPANLPDRQSMMDDLDALVTSLTEAMNAPILERYSGPVLLAGEAAPQLFRELLARPIMGWPDPVGVGRRMPDPIGSLEQKLGQLVLPRTFRVYDDPTVKKVGHVELFGNYEYDDEGTKARRVELVEKGRLINMLMSRVPTKKLSGTNGHGRRCHRARMARTSVGALFIEDSGGVDEKELSQKLIEAAKAEGLEFGLRVTKTRASNLGYDPSDMMSLYLRMRRGGEGISDPIVVHKVYLDGHEERVRGCEFGAIKLRDLRDIIAAGKKAHVHNFVGPGPHGVSPWSSIVAPSILLEYAELSKVKQEFARPPVLKSPRAR